MRAFHPHGEVERQVETLVEGIQPGQRGAGQGDAMIGPVAGDDLLAGLFAARIGGIPHELDLGVVGFRAGVGEEHLAHRHGRDFLQLLGQGDARLMALAAEDMAERQRPHLRRRGFGQFLLAPAQRRAPQPAHRLQIVLAVGVMDKDAPAARDHGGAGFAQPRQVGEGMQQARHVARLDIAQGHIFLPDDFAGLYPLHPDWREGLRAWRPCLRRNPKLGWTK